MRVASRNQTRAEARDRNYLKRLARSTGFEPVTPAFGGQAPANLPDHASKFLKSEWEPLSEYGRSRVPLTPRSPYKRGEFCASHLVLAAEIACLIIIFRLFS